MTSLATLQIMNKEQNNLYNSKNIHIVYYMYIYINT